MAAGRSARSPLRLLAQDADDLTVISAALQEAVARVGDIQFDPVRRTLTVAVSRFRWEAEAAGPERVRAAVQFGGVLAVRSRNLRRDAADAVISILSVGFQAGEPPGGVLTIALAGGGDVQVDLECLDAALSDTGDPWPARGRPDHEEP